MRINATTVAKLKLEGGKSERIDFDYDLPRFGVRLREGGKRTWIIQYRLGSKQRRMTIGDLASLDADDARKTARTALAKVDLGNDPQSEKNEKRARASETLGKLAEEYLAARKAGMRPRSYEEVERHLTKHWAPLSEFAAHQIDKRQIASRLADIHKESGPVAANRARASLSAMFRWAMGRGFVEANPVIGTEKPGKEQSRDRVLSNAELADIWNACRDDDYGRIVCLLMLTGQRRDEVGGIADDELDLAGRLWTLPGERTKNGRAHEVPLSDAALHILRAAPRRDQRAFLFGMGEGSFSGWSGAKELLDDRMLATIKDRAGKKAKLAPWRLHDLRRTMATRMTDDLGVQPHVVEAILNHVSGHKAGVAGIYNRALYRAEKRQALDRWAAHVENLTSGKADNVVALAHRRDMA
jgi:integrase